MNVVTVAYIGTIVNIGKTTNVGHVFDNIYKSNVVESMRVSENPALNYQVGRLEEGRQDTSNHYLYIKRLQSHISRLLRPFHYRLDSFDSVPIN